MKILFWILLLLCSIAATGCRRVTPVIHEGDNRLNYKSIFDEDAGPDVNVINSVYVTYKPSLRPGVVTTPDYEIELIVTKQWMEKKAKQLYLRKADEISSEPNSFIGKHIRTRIEQRIRQWYVPKDISEYECYYLYGTSIPYIHMLVDKTPVSDNRYRVFLSKH